MSGLRLALVTRRFWPVMGGAETALSNLARGLLDAGAVPKIVTGRLDSRWPSEVVHREIPVVRLPFPARYRWGRMRFMIALSRWLRKNQLDIDLVCISHISHEAYSAVGACLGDGMPVVLRAEANETFDRSQLARTVRGSEQVLRRCLLAKAVIATTRNGIEQASQLGFERQRIHLIPNGVPRTIERLATHQSAARLALADANHDLLVPAHMPVVVYVGQLSAEHRVDVLVEAWGRIASRWPDARLWLVGDGPERERLYRMIRDRDLLGRVLMPGVFDTVDEILQAADLLVSPTVTDKEPLPLLEAFAAGLPVLVSDAPGHLDSVKDGVTGRVFKSNSPVSLANALTRALSDRDESRRMAAAALKFVRQSRSVREMALAHLRLFRNVVHSHLRSVS